jgi:hypothetical protein
MFALADSTGVGGGNSRGGASPSVVDFSIKATSSLIFAHICSVPVALAVKGLHHNAIFNEEHIVM